MRLKELANKRKMHDFFRDITKDDVVYDGSWLIFEWMRGKKASFNNLIPPHYAFYYFQYYEGINKVAWLIGAGKVDSELVMVCYNRSFKEHVWVSNWPLQKDGRIDYEKNISLCLSKEFERAGNIDKILDDVNTQSCTLAWLISEHNKEVVSVGRD